MRSIVVAFVVVVVVGFVVGACSDEDQILNPPRDAYRTWEMIAPEGAVCGNDSQFKFFVNYSDKTDDLVVVFESGGACWDYEECPGQNGIRGAANPNGLTDYHW